MAGQGDKDDRWVDLGSSAVAGDPARLDLEISEARRAIFTAFSRLEHHGVDWAEDPTQRVGGDHGPPADATAQEPAAAPGAGPLRVMVVDDFPPIRRLVAEYVAVAGHDVVAEAADGEQALRILTGAPCDVVIMDINMPGIGGVEATRRLSARAGAPSVIGFSSDESGETERAMLEAGAAAYVIKDDIDGLMATLGRLAGERGGRAPACE